MMRIMAISKMALNMFKNINLPAFLALIVYPVFLIVLLVRYSMYHTIGMHEVVIAIIGYYGSNISVGVGLHRLWSHNAFKTNKFVEFILLMMSAGTLQGPILSWASNHYKHHTFTDKEQDPHSPFKYKNLIIGFLWSHIGWMLIGEGSHKTIDRVTMHKLGKSELLRWQLKYYWQLAVFMNLVLPLAVGYCIFGNASGAYMTFLFIGIGRAIQQQGTFCVNSLCHFAGTRRYYNGTAGDIWWMALFLLGENWHNFHHAFPSDYRCGPKWYQFDVHKWIIYLMSKLGLAWDLDRTPEVRIKAKINDNIRYTIETRKQRLSIIEDKIAVLVENVRTKLNDLENSSLSMQNQVKKSFAEIYDALNRVADNLHSSLSLSESSSEKLLNSATKKINDIERSLSKLYQKYDFA